MEYGNATIIRELDATPTNLNDPDLNLLTQPGHQITRVYDAMGRMTQETSAAGVVKTCTYDTRGNLLTETVNGTDTTSYTYDAGSRLLKKVLPEQYTGSASDLGTTYTYHANGLLASKTDPLGNTTSYTYDVYGNKKTETQPNGVVYSYDYDRISRPIRKFITENGVKTTLEEYQYDQDLGDCLINGDGTTYRKDTKTVYGGEVGGATTSQVKDMCRRVIRTHHPDGSIEQTRYNANGTVSETINPRGQSTYYTYNGLLQPSEVRTYTSTYTSTNGDVDYYSARVLGYDREGRQTSEKTGINLVTRNAVPSSWVETRKSYYPNGKVASEEVVNGKKTEYEYDADGNLTKRSEWLDGTRKIVKDYTNNHRGQPLSEVQSIVASDLYQNSATTLTKSYTYDKNGNQLSTTSPEGTLMQMTYDAKGQLLRTSITSAGKTVTTWQTYDTMGKITAQTDKNGHVTNNTYDLRGNLIRQETHDGICAHVAAWAYDGKNREIMSVTPGNYKAGVALGTLNRTETKYDAMDRVVLKKHVYQDAGGTWVEQVAKAYAYDAAGNVVKEVTGEAVDAATGATVDEKLLELSAMDGVEYTYDGRNLLLTTRDAETKRRSQPFTTRFSYDGVGRKILDEDANGMELWYTHSNNGDVTAKILGFVTSLWEGFYLRSGERLTDERDGNGNISTYTYNSLGLRASETHPGDATVPANTRTYKYDAMGRMVYSTDSAGVTTTRTYDYMGNALSETTGGVTTSKTYDAMGNVLTETDGNGDATTYTYDDKNRLIATARGGLTEHVSYTRDGNVLTKTDGYGNTTLYGYDALGRQTLEVDPYGQIVRSLGYNKNNVQTANRVLQDDGTYAETSYTYDKNDRLLKTTYPEGNEEEKTYSNGGQVATSKDGNGNTTTYAYDNLGRLASVTNALNQITSYTYDVLGNVTSQTDGRGNTNSIAYNARNLPKARIDAGGLNANGTYKTGYAERYTYTADGLLASTITRKGDTLAYTYDARGNRLSETAGTQSVTRTYDGAGNELSMTDATGTTTRTYDARGRVLTKTVPQFGTTTYVYDQNGTQNERMTDSAGNLTTKTYDKLGRLESVTSLGGKTTYAYDTAGRTQTVQNPNGTTERYTYDKNNQLTTLENRQGETVTDRYVYTYDDAGNQLTKAETVNGVENPTASFAYDVLNRLSTAEERDGKRYAYAYDASGNRTSTTVRDRATNAVVSSESYSYDARNRMEMYMDPSGMPLSVSYDANGNVTEDANGGYVYDAFSRLTTHVKFISGGTEETHYAYNGDGQRTSKTDSNNVSTYYQYEYDKVVLEQKSTGEVTRNTYGLNLISRSTGKVQEKSLNANMSVKVSYNETLYYQYNGHADVTRLSDASGIEKASYTYDAFGNVLESTGTENNPYRYAGYTYDEESSLYYLNARYYNPKTARFQSQDMFAGYINDPLSLNLYTYCANNPIRYWDPTGYAYEDLNPKDKEKLDHYDAMIAANAGIKANADIVARLEADREQLLMEATARAVSGNIDTITNEMNTTGILTPSKNTNDVTGNVLGNDTNEVPTAAKVADSTAGMYTAGGTDWNTTFASPDEAAEALYYDYYGFTDYTQFEFGSAIYEIQVKDPTTGKMVTRYGFTSPIAGGPHACQPKDANNKEYKLVPDGGKIVAYAHSHPGTESAWHTKNSDAFSEGDMEFVGALPLYVLSPAGNIRRLDSENVVRNQDGTINQYETNLRTTTVGTGLTFRGLSDTEKYVYMMTYGRALNEHIDAIQNGIIDEGDRYHNGTDPESSPAARDYTRWEPQFNAVDLKNQKALNPALNTIRNNMKGRFAQTADNRR